MLKKIKLEIFEKSDCNLNVLKRKTLIIWQIWLQFECAKNLPRPPIKIPCLQKMYFIALSHKKYIFHKLIIGKNQPVHFLSVIVSVYKYLLYLIWEFLIFGKIKLSNASLIVTFCYSCPHWAYAWCIKLIWELPKLL